MALMKMIGFSFFIVALGLCADVGASVSRSFLKKEYKVESVLDKDVMLVCSTISHQLVNISTNTRRLGFRFALPSGALLSTFQVQKNGKWKSPKRVTQDVAACYDSGRAKRGAKAKYTAILYKRSNDDFYPVFGKNRERNEIHGLSSATKSERSLSNKRKRKGRDPPRIFGRDSDR